jgi:hypothetical protein
MSVKFPRPRHVAITFGKPIFPGELPQDMPEKERRRVLLDSLESALIGMRDGACQ